MKQYSKIGLLTVGGILGLAIILYLANVLIFSLVKKTESGPIKAAKIQFQDNEFLKYSKFEGGEKTNTLYMVTTIDRAHDEIVLYSDMVKTDKEWTIPDDFHNYMSFYKIDLNKSSLKRRFYDASKVDLSYLKIEVPSIMDLNVDYDKNVVTIESQFTNGGEIRTTRSRQELTPGFPVWDVDSMTFIGARMMDASKGGIFYVIEPFFIKAPIIASLRIVQKEVVVTKAGTFNTLKVGFTISNPFVGALINSITSKMFFWIEDAPRGLIVKTQYNNSVNLLDEVGIWTKTKNPSLASTGENR